MNGGRYLASMSPSEHALEEMSLNARAPKLLRLVYEEFMMVLVST